MDLPRPWTCASINCRLENDYTVHFVARFSKPIERFGGHDQVFYTNLYRSYSQRADLSDVNGMYVDMYEKVRNEMWNIYIQSATLNGKPLGKPWFYHSEIIHGGKLVFDLGPEPDRSWGAGLENAPPSMTRTTTI